MTPARLALERVACLRGGRLLFEGINLTLDPGDAALVTGPNGTGKSSLLRLISGLLDPAAGTIDRRGGIALSDENAALDRHLPLGDALAFWAQLDGRELMEVRTALDQMGIGHLDRVPVRMLSTGQRKRATLARVLASGAAIWLLDEPGNGMDADALARLAEAMAAHRSTGGIVVAATHQPVGLDDAVTLRLGT